MTVDELDDLDRLFLRHAHLVDLLIWVNVETVRIADAFDLLGRSLKVEPLALVETKHDVLGSREHIHEPEVLMDHADAMLVGILGRGNRHGAALYLNLAIIWKIDAREHVHERCLTAAILAKQS